MADYIGAGLRLVQSEFRSNTTEEQNNREVVSLLRSLTGEKKGGAQSGKPVSWGLRDSAIVKNS